ncbi:hypothetical protein GCM10025783_28000 [Amnibacterium soli]|uniref:Polysaccharide biosynthesis protein n=1 Tax=Amnibacterium soli TaxID=1282736 RepID=A0ABP8ZDL0_9MICO
MSIFSQALAFVAGVLIIRSLDRVDYAAYSLSSTILGAVVIIADAGINSAMMAAAARADQAGRFAALLAAALRWRRTIWAIAIVPTLGLLLFLLVSSGTSLVAAVLIAVLTGALSFNSLSIGLLSIDYQISGRFTALQVLDIVNAGLRVALIGVAAMIGVGGVLIYLSLGLVIGIAQRGLMARAISSRHAALPFTPEDRRIFGAAIRSTLAVSVFLIVGDQLVNVLLVLRGNPLAIADVAALGRFAVAFGLVNGVMANIAAPYIARAGGTRRDVLRASCAVVCAYGLICVAYVLGVVLFEPLLLQVLGPRYDHLRSELVVVAAGAAVSNFASWGLGLVTHSRGWLAHSWLYGPLLALWALWGLLVPDVSTTLGACALAATLGLPLLISQAIRIVAGVRGLEPRKAEVIP